VVLPLFHGDLARLLFDAASGHLEAAAYPSWHPEDPATAACVVLAAGGYPDHYESGDVISGLDAVRSLQDVVAFHAGTRRTGPDIVTAGGRVLGVTAIERSAGFAAALERCYDAVKQIHFDRMHYRRDIGHRALRSRH
jgi:phosphoribosylamine--glycine ligase